MVFAGFAGHLKIDWHWLLARLRVGVFPLYGPLLLLNLALQLLDVVAQTRPHSCCIYNLLCLLCPSGWLLSGGCWLAFFFTHAFPSALSYCYMKWKNGKLLGLRMHWLAGFDCRMPFIWLAQHAAQHLQWVLLLLWAKLFSFASRTKPQPQPQTSRVFFFCLGGQVNACNAQ